MPPRRIAARQHFDHRRRRQHLHLDALRARAPLGVARASSAAGAVPFTANASSPDSVTNAPSGKSSSLRLCSRLARPSSRSACSTSSISGALARAPRPANFSAKSLRLLAAAFEAGPVAGGERGRLVEEKQLRVIAAPDVALPALEAQHAADPLPRCVAPFRQRPVVAMEFAAAIAEQRAARVSRAALRTDRRGSAAAWVVRFIWPTGMTLRRMAQKRQWPSATAGRRQWRWPSASARRSDETGR